jgi:hypothetical protein
MNTFDNNQAKQEVSLAMQVTLYPDRRTSTYYPRTGSVLTRFALNTAIGLPVFAID